MIPLETTVCEPNVICSFVCARVSQWQCERVKVCACVFVWVDKRVCVCVCVCFWCVCVSVHAQKCVSVCMCVCIGECLCVCLRPGATERPPSSNRPGGPHTCPMSA